MYQGIKVKQFAPRHSYALFLSQKFIKDPYTTTMGSFSRVTNFLRDVLMQSEIEEIPSRIPEELNEDIPGMEISNLDEPGFEVVTKVTTITDKEYVYHQDV